MYPYSLGLTIYVPLYLLPYKNLNSTNIVTAIFHYPKRSVKELGGISQQSNAMCRGEQWFGQITKPNRAARFGSVRFEEEFSSVSKILEFGTPNGNPKKRALVNGLKFGTPFSTCTLFFTQKITRSLLN